MRIKDLPQEIKELALVRQFEQDGTTAEDSLLLTAFEFERTPEGWKFWSRIARGKFNKFKTPKKKSDDKLDDLSFAVEKMRGFIGNGIQFVELKQKQKKDSIVEEVLEKFKKRSELGIQKYGTTLDREDLTFEQWIEHAIEEAMDLTLYLQKIKNELINKTS
jgi:hypothetical protein